MEWIQRLLESGTTPIVTAFLLGLLTAISPCPLATNIAAVGFIGKDIDDKHRVFCNGLLYTAGRILTYAGIGLAFIPLLREGANTYALQKIIGKFGTAQTRADAYKQMIDKQGNAGRRAKWIVETLNVSLKLLL